MFSDYNGMEFARQAVAKYSNNKNFTETRSVRTDEQKDRQTDILKLIIAFLNFVNSPNKIVLTRITVT